MALPLLPILVGPTAGGKTALALAVAERLGLEIVGADSRQVYAGLSIATAAPEPAELARVRHHLVGHVPLAEPYSAGRFAREARVALGLPPVEEDRLAEAETGAPGTALLVGGSLFYIRAFLDPVDPRLAAAEERRAEVRALGDELSPEALKARLVALDPEAAWIPVGDRSKIERYLEIGLASGLPPSRALREWVRPRPVEARIFALVAPPAWLADRIRARSWRMLHKGMLAEIQAALAAGIPQDGNALKSVGVAEVREHLEGNIDLPRCHDLLVRRTRRYAKKQLTWIRGLAMREPIQLLDARRPLDELVEEVVAGIGQAREGGPA